VQPAPASTPTVSITLKDRHGHATPECTGCTHTGGGNIDIQRPSPDTVVITMSAVAVATGGPHSSAAVVHFDLDQCFEVVFEKPEVKAAKLTMDGRVIGLLRGGCKNGRASESGGCATVTCSNLSLVSVGAPDHAVAGGENLSINDKEGPVSASIAPGTYTLHQTWMVSAEHTRALFGKAASAEFAPDPALDPLWISYKEPFHGANKKDFGFRITIKVADDTPPEPTREK
jgi:hypothetical protein